MTAIEKVWITEDGYVAFVVHHYRSSSNGWYCGYVGVDEGHPLFGHAYNVNLDILDGKTMKEQVSVGEEGLTFSGPGKFFARGFEILDLMPSGWEKLWFFGFDFLYGEGDFNVVVEDCNKLSGWLKSVEERWH